MRTWVKMGLAAGLTACSAGGGDGGSGGGGAFEPIEGPAVTITYAATYDRLSALAAGAVTTATFGDVSAAVQSEATTPSDVGSLASVYYETDGFRAMVEGASDTRDGRPERTDAGARAAQAIATAFTQGSLSPTPSGQRGSPGWHAQAVLRIDEAMLLQVASDLEERSAAGFDRALGYLIDAEGAPHGLGKRIADADAACGTDYYGALSGALGGARGPFEAALAAFGLPDALDRLRIEPGQSAEYEAALVLADKALVQGLGTAFLALLEQPMSATVQAAALATFEGLAADVALADGHTCLTEPLEADAVDSVFRALDAATPGEIDLPLVRCLVQQTLEIAPCGG